MRIKRWVGILFAFGAVVFTGVVYAQSDVSKGLLVGPLQVDAESTSFHAGMIEYKNAHLTGKDGLSLNADLMMFNLKAQGAQMTGHVQGHFTKTADSEDITVNADKAVFDSVKNQVDLIGNVKVTIFSLYTDGPLVQTGDSAVVQLGAVPEYPQITMNHVHTTFTPGH